MSVSCVCCKDSDNWFPGCSPAADLWGVSTTPSGIPGKVLLGYNLGLPAQAPGPLENHSRPPFSKIDQSVSVQFMLTLTLTLSPTLTLWVHLLTQKEWPMHKAGVFLQTASNRKSINWFLAHNEALMISFSVWSRGVLRMRAQGTECLWWVFLPCAKPHSPLPDSRWDVSD